jgi:hypothetical protein
VPAVLVGFEDFDVDDTEDEVQYKKNGRDGHIRHDYRLTTEALYVRRVWRALRIYAFPLVEY